MNCRRPLSAAGVPVLIVVDHHEPQNFLTQNFVISRRREATATIYTSYIENGLLAMQKGRRHTAVAIGAPCTPLTIRVDLSGADMDDFHAACVLRQFRDSEPAWNTS